VIPSGNEATHATARLRLNRFVAMGAFHQIIPLSALLQLSCDHLRDRLAVFDYFETGLN
jgi:hypothetical protein